MHASRWLRLPSGWDLLKRPASIMPSSAGSGSHLRAIDKRWGFKGASAIRRDAHDCIASGTPGRCRSVLMRRSDKAISSYGTPHEPCLRCLLTFVVDTASAFRPHICAPVLAAALHA